MWSLVYTKVHSQPCISKLLHLQYRVPPSFPSQTGRVPVLLQIFTIPIATSLVTVSSTPNLQTPELRELTGEFLQRLPLPVDVRRLIALFDRAPRALPPLLFSFVNRSDPLCRDHSHSLSPAASAKQLLLLLLLGG